MSVITVSAIFLAEIIGIANELFRLPYLLVVAVIYAAMLLSESKKQLLLKWVLSLPFSFFCFEYFWQTHYSIRALNWIIEGYGTQSAGGNFSGFIVLILLLVLCFAGMIFAYSKSSEKIKRYIKDWKKAKRIIALIGALILIGLYLAVLILGITASPATKGVLMAAIGCTIVLPCLLYAMMLIARVLSGRRENEDESSDKN